MKAYRDPVHRARVLQQERAIEAELFRPHTHDELEEAARFLGREDLLPTAQADWLEAHAA